MDNEIIYALGFPENQRNAAAALYEHAFGSLIMLAIPNRGKRRSLLSECFCPDFAFAALLNRELVGLAGFHTPHGMLTGGMTEKFLLSRLGIPCGTWASVVLRMYARYPRQGELVMDGIAVREDLRGHGIGGKLLDLVEVHARQHGFRRIRLDVIDTNTAARRLYERRGFQAAHTRRVPPPAMAAGIWRCHADGA
jgi:GNAT superfamily N-acetyltransferase